MKFSTFIRIDEASLSGKSRSSGKSKWDTYLVPIWKKSDGYDYSLAKDSAILSDLDKKETLYSGNKGAKIKIMSKDVTKAGASTYAKVKLKDKPRLDLSVLVILINLIPAAKRGLLLVVERIQKSSLLINFP